MRYYLNNQVDYRVIDKRFGSVTNKRCIDGRITGSNKCIGFCNYADHPGYVTSEIAQKHMCFEKGCGYFIQKTRELVCAPQKENGDIYSKIVESVYEQCNAFEGMKIINHKISGNKIVFYYVTISKEYRFDMIVQSFDKALFGLEIEFRVVPCEYTDAVNIIFDMRLAV